MELTKDNYKSITPQQWLVIIDVMDNFDFNKVENHMINNNWTWSLTDEYGEPDYRIPNQSEIRMSLRSLLIRAFNEMNFEKTQSSIDCPICHSTGGFTVYVWPNDTCNVYFSVTDWMVDTDIFDT